MLVDRLIVPQMLVSTPLVSATTGAARKGAGRLEAHPRQERQDDNSEAAERDCGGP
jgi:hypothetical protein